MLNLTENASTILKQIAEQGGPEIAGLRFSSDDPAEQSLAVSPAAAAEPGDQVVEQDGATVFLDASAAQQLDDKVLDAGVDEDGGVQLAIAQQG
mgnify:CR=1 FL=1